MQTEYTKHSKHYDETHFISKIGKIAGFVSGGFLTKLVTLWYALRDKDTPTWAKSIILGTLGYFILPLDAIPDLLPIIGFSDDLTALVSATAMIWAHIKPEHTNKAKGFVSKMLGK